MSIALSSTAPAVCTGRPAQPASVRAGPMLDRLAAWAARQPHRHRHGHWTLALAAAAHPRRAGR